MAWVWSPISMRRTRICASRICPMSTAPPITGIDEGTMKRTFLSLLIVFTSPLAAQDQDLVLITVNPCVIFDTRPAQGGTGAFAAEEERSFSIAGSTADFAAQGGTAGGCGVPGWSGGQPVAKAI